MSVHAKSPLQLVIKKTTFSEEELEEFKKMDENKYNFQCEGFNKWLQLQGKEPILNNIRSPGKILF